MRSTSSSTRASPCSPARRAPANPSCSTHSACCSATVSSRASSDRAPTAPSSPPYSTSQRRATRSAGSPKPNSIRARRASVAPRAGRAGTQPRVDQRAAGHARPTRRTRRGIARPAWPARAPGVGGRRGATRAARRVRRPFHDWYRRVADAWRTWRDAVARRDAAATAARGECRRARCARRTAARSHGVGGRPHRMGRPYCIAAQARQRGGPDRGDHPGGKCADRRRRCAFATACSTRAEPAAGECGRRCAERRRGAARAGGDPGRRGSARASRLPAAHSTSIPPSMRASKRV